MRHVRIVAATAFAAVIGSSPLWVGAQSGKETGTKKASSASSAGAGAPGAACIAPSIASSVEECPANAPKLDKGGSLLGKSQAPKSNLATSARKKEAAKEQQKGPSIEIDAATLRNQTQTQAKADALLEKEITVLKRLIKNTPVDSPKRPDVLLRLAETFFELQQTTNAKVRALRRADLPGSAAEEQGEGQAASGAAEAAEKKLEEYRKEAIKAYATLVQDHPNFKRMDEVLFALGFSLDEMKQSDKAREVYYRLIKNFPESKFVPNAYLSFAEHYFAPGRHDRCHQVLREGHRVPARTQRRLRLRALQAGLVFVQPRGLQGLAPEVRRSHRVRQGQSRRRATSRTS